MPLQNYQYDTIMREYNRRQAQNRRIQEEHQAEAYEKNIGTYGRFSAEQGAVKYIDPREE